MVGTFKYGKPAVTFRPRPEAFWYHLALVQLATTGQPNFKKIIEKRRKHQRALSVSLLITETRDGFVTSGHGKCYNHSGSRLCNGVLPLSSITFVFLFSHQRDFFFLLTSGVKVHIRSRHHMFCVSFSLRSILCFPELEFCNALMQMVIYRNNYLEF